MRKVMDDTMEKCFTDKFQNAIMQYSDFDHMPVEKGEMVQKLRQRKQLKKKRTNCFVRCTLDAYPSLSSRISVYYRTTHPIIYQRHLQC
jgi:hypothetical protein